MTEETVRYYARRAQEYDRVYTLERWQAGLAILHACVPALFAVRRVYEVACGTGYWTVRLAGVAESVEASDTNEETLAVARFEIVKNLFDEAELAALVAPYARDARVEMLGAFWVVTYARR